MANVFLVSRVMSLPLHSWYENQKRRDSENILLSVSSSALDFLIYFFISKLLTMLLNIRKSNQPNKPKQPRMCFFYTKFTCLWFEKRQDSSITFIQFYVNNLNKTNLGIVLDILFLLFYALLNTSILSFYYSFMWL